MNVTVVISGTPKYERLEDIAHHVNELFDTCDESIGRFAIRHLQPSPHSSKPLIALDFDDGFQAATAQSVLDGYEYTVPDGRHYILRARMTSGPKLAYKRHSSSALVPLHSKELVQKSKELDYEFNFLQKQIMVEKAKRKLLRIKKKVSKELKKIDKESDSERKSKKRKKKEKERRKPKEESSLSLSDSASDESMHKPSTSYKKSKKHKRDKSPSPVVISQKYAILKSPQRKSPIKRSFSICEYDRSSSSETRRSPIARYLTRYTPSDASPKTRKYPPKRRSPIYGYTRRRSPSAGSSHRSRSPIARSFKRRHSPSPRRGRSYCDLSPDTHRSRYRSPYRETHPVNKYRYEERLPRRHSPNVRRLSNNPSTHSRHTEDESPCREKIDLRNKLNSNKKDAKDSEAFNIIVKTLKDDLINEIMETFEQVIKGKQISPTDKDLIKAQLKDNVKIGFQNLKVNPQMSLKEVLALYRDKHTMEDDKKLIHKLLKEISTFNRMYQPSGGTVPSQTFGVLTGLNVQNESDKFSDKLWDAVDEVLQEIPNLQDETSKIETTPKTDEANEPIEIYDTITTDGYRNSLKDDISITNEIDRVIVVDKTIKVTETALSVYTGPKQDYKINKNPQFVIPIKNITRTMKSIIKSFNIAEDRTKIFFEALRRSLRSRLRGIMKDKPYMSSGDITKLYRDVHPKVDDEDFLKDLYERFANGEFDNYLEGDADEKDPTPVKENIDSDSNAEHVINDNIKVNETVTTEIHKEASSDDIRPVEDNTNAAEGNDKKVNLVLSTEMSTASVSDGLNQNIDMFDQMEESIESFRLYVSTIESSLKT